MLDLLELELQVVSYSRGRWDMYMPSCLSLQLAPSLMIIKGTDEVNIQIVTVHRSLIDLLPVLAVASWSPQDLIGESP